MCATAFIANLFWGYEIKQFMYDSMIYLIMVGLGVTVTEKFAPLNKNTDNKSNKGLF